MKSKIAMVGVMSNPVQRLTSHNGGWTLVVKSILENSYDCEIDILTEKDDWNEYETLIIHEGINYKFRSYNFFGGVSQQVFDRLEKFSKFVGDVYSIDNIDYNHMVKSRKELKDLSTNNYRTPEVIEINKMSENLILGDSHSVSVFKPGYCISRNDGKTLNGFLKNGIKSYLSDYTKKLIFYAGNIDIRFHTHRFGGSHSLYTMSAELEKQLKELNLEEISIVAVLPIENESRKIPGTGKYKGQNFYGSWIQRMHYVVWLNDLLESMCIRNNWNFLKWPFDYNTELSFDDMEARQSVHLRPTSYMFANQFIKQEKENELTLF